jgi:hypothetical protein
MNKRRVWWEIMGIKIKQYILHRNEGFRQECKTDSDWKWGPVGGG